MIDPPVITVTSTIMDGTVVRWFRNLGEAELQQPVLAASRHGVSVHAPYLTDIADTWVADARRAHEELRRDRRANMTGWATHQQREVTGFRSGPLEPIKKKEG
ncbi:hypothetical protein [Actinomadura sp. 21ATH]|uniref:hypothetical protein n=1 Tax=Actinomadura sp. 21ATH TaxID=1735444 RepID=UPI0035C1831A